MNVDSPPAEGYFWLVTARRCLTIHLPNTLTSTQLVYQQSAVAHRSPLWAQDCRNFSVKQVEFRCGLCCCRVPAGNCFDTSQWLNGHEGSLRAALSKQKPQAVQGQHSCNASGSTRRLGRLLLQSFFRVRHRAIATSLSSP